MKKKQTDMDKEQLEKENVYKKIMRSKKHINKDIFIENPISRETTVRITNTKYIIIKIDDWTDYSLIFVSDENYNLLPDNTLFEIWAHINIDKHLGNSNDTND